MPDLGQGYSAVSDVGDQLYIRTAGIRTGEPGALAALGRGEDVDPSSYYFRTNVRLESSDPALPNRLYIGARPRHRHRVIYSAYRVS
ncbi:DUF3237 family protein [Leifsonia sp. NPDC056665]|uniref:DUF3237 family protein n=1 Tax=Leifsonia sp. NPDC056665 TaxID=3345901 RepID=UPI0036C5AE87